jgi:hypothetical protein
MKLDKFHKIIEETPEEVQTEIRQKMDRLESENEKPHQGETPERVVTLS